MISFVTHLPSVMFTQWGPGWGVRPDDTLERERRESMLQNRRQQHEYRAESDRASSRVRALRSRKRRLEAQLQRAMRSRRSTEARRTRSARLIGSRSYRDRFYSQRRELDNEIQRYRQRLIEIEKEIARLERLTARQRHDTKRSSRELDRIRRKIGIERREDMMDAIRDRIVE